MDIPSIEELKEKKRRLFKKIPEDTVFRKHIPKQVELDRIHRCTEGEGNS